MAKGGHSVPDNKIKERYAKSISLLKKHIDLFNRVYVLDNSQNEIRLVVSFNDGKLEKVYAKEIPLWINFIM